MNYNLSYPISHKSQEKKNFNPTEFLLNNSYLSYDNKYYLQSARGAAKAVLTFINRFRKAPLVALKNKTIAKHTGYCVRTVQRVTHDLHKRGILIKSQEHQYAVNDYFINKALFSRKDSYRLWHEELTPENRSFWDTFGFIVKSATRLHYQYTNVILNKSSLSLNINIIKNVPYNARARRLTNVNVDKDNHKKRGVAMLLAEHKQIIENAKNEPTIRDTILKPKVAELLFPSVLEKVVTLLDLTFQEKLKLTAFSDDALDYGVMCIETFLKKKPSTPPIADRVAWFIKLATNFMIKKNDKPDWSFYYTLCHIFGLKSHEPSTIRPLTVPLPQTKKISTYKSTEPQGAALIEHLQASIKQAQVTIGVYENNLFNDFAGYMLESIKNKLARESARLDTLLSDQKEGITSEEIPPTGANDGTVSLSDQGNPDSMAACTNKQGTIF